MQDDEHRCRAGQRCLALTPDGSAITSRPDTLCYACVGRLQEQYDQLPEIREVLPLFKGGLGGVSGEAKVASSREAPCPLNVGVVDLVDLIDEIIADIRGLPIADLVRQDDGVRRALKIGKAWKRADGVVGFTRKWTRRIQPCPKCNLRTLGTFAGSDSIQCSSCGEILTRDEYSRMCLV